MPMAKPIAKCIGRLCTPRNLSRIILVPDSASPCAKYITMEYWPRSFRYFKPFSLCDSKLESITMPAMPIIANKSLIGIFSLKLCRYIK